MCIRTIYFFCISIWIYIWRRYDFFKKIVLYILDKRICIRLKKGMIALFTFFEFHLVWVSRSTCTRLENNWIEFFVVESYFCVQNGYSSKNCVILTRCFSSLVKWFVDREQVIGQHIAIKKAFLGHFCIIYILHTITDQYAI